MSARVFGHRGWKGALTALIAAALMFTGIGAASAAPTPGTGSVSGTVTRASDGMPASHIFVRVTDGTFNASFSATTDDAGAYQITGVAPGTYRVSFGDPTGAFVTQWWNGAATSSAAQSISVADGSDLTGIDAAMIASVSISGHVSKASDGLPVQGAVRAEGSAGTFYASIDGDGLYTLHVSPGTYTVFFQSYDPTVTDEYWEHATTKDAATLVTIAAGENVTRIDAALGSPVFIRGTVSVDGSPDIVHDHFSSIAVVAWAHGAQVGMAYIHADGTYAIKVPAGSYTVVAEGTEGLAWGLARQYYSHASSEADATPVTVAASGDTTGIDFDLALVPATVAVSAGSAHPGDALHVTGSGFAPQEPVQIELHSAPILLASVFADADGVVDTTVTIPTDSPAGDHRIVLTGAMSTVTGSAPLALVAPTDTGVPGGPSTDGPGTGTVGTATDPASSPASGTAQLAATGAELPNAALALGMLMLLIGLVAIRIRRRA